MYFRVRLAVQLGCFLFASAVLGGEVSRSLGDWNASYSMPDGWQVIQGSSNSQVYSDGSNQAMIVVAAGLYNTTDEVIADLHRLLPGVFQSLGLQGAAEQQPHVTRVQGREAVEGRYRLTGQTFQSYQARSVTIMSGHGTAIGVLIIATPNRYEEMSALADRLAGSVRAEAPRYNQQAIAGLSGKWTYYDGASSGRSGNSGYTSRSYEETVYFDGAGHYSWSSAGHVAVDTRVSDTGVIGSASNISENSDQGSYTIIGNSLIVKGRHGMFTYDIQLQGNQLISNGRVYIRG